MTSQGGSSNHFRLTTAFELSIGAPILPGMVAAGRFVYGEDTVEEANRAVKAPPPAVSLACASSGQRVVIHNNNTKTAEAKRSAKRGETMATASGGATLRGEGASDMSLQVLNFGKEPTALAAGALLASSNGVASQRDALLFGAASSLLAYDVERNKQLFYKDVEDGVQAMVSGVVRNNDGAEPVPLAVVGGNCSVFGFDGTGNERYWTVTGDQVTAMALLPWEEGSTGGSSTMSAPLSLLAASEDFEIRVYNGEELAMSFHEVDRVRMFVPLWRPSRYGEEAPAPHSSGSGALRFAYLLDNGTVGVYEGGKRVWRIKGKSPPVSAAFCDVDGDGVEELVVGWENGRVEVRSDTASGREKGGTVLFQDTYTTSVAAVLSEDYQQTGTRLPLVCTVDGTVRGLTLLESRKEEAVEVRNLQALESLVEEQQLLTAQLASLDAQLERCREGKEDSTMPEAGVEVQWQCSPNLSTHQVDLSFTLHRAGSTDVGEAVIHSCLLTAETWASTTDGTMSFGAPPDKIGPSLSCCVEYPEDVGLSIQALVVVGSSYAEHYQVHEVTVNVPRFILLQPLRVLEHLHAAAPVDQVPRYTAPSGYVVLRWREALQMDVIHAWLRESFHVPADVDLSNSTKGSASFPALHLELFHVRDGQSLGIDVCQKTVAGEPFNTITVHSNSLAMCGDIISAMAEVPSGLAENGAFPTEVRCEVSPELDRLRDIFTRVEEFNEVRVKLSTEMADAATIVKTLLTRAEDARLLSDMETMKKFYVALYDVNQELLGENAKRMRNYDELKAALKEVNTFIQNAGKVRLGPARTKLISDCRTALKENKLSSLLEVIRTGEE